MSGTSSVTSPQACRPSWNPVTGCKRQRIPRPERVQRNGPFKSPVSPATCYNGANNCPRRATAGNSEKQEIPERVPVCFSCDARGTPYGLRHLLQRDGALCADTGSAPAPWEPAQRSGLPQRSGFPSGATGARGANQSKPEGGGSSFAPVSSNLQR